MQKYLGLMLNISQGVKTMACEPVLVYQSLKYGLQSDQLALPMTPRHFIMIALPPVLLRDH